MLFRRLLREGGSVRRARSSSVHFGMQYCCRCRASQRGNGNSACSIGACDGLDSGGSGFYDAVSTASAKPNPSRDLHKPNSAKRLKSGAGSAAASLGVSGPKARSGRMLSRRLPLLRASLWASNFRMGSLCSKTRCIPSDRGQMLSSSKDLLGLYTICLGKGTMVTLLRKLRYLVHLYWKAVARDRQWQGHRFTAHGI